jgi:hypothetical protein
MVSVVTRICLELSWAAYAGSRLPASTYTLGDGPWLPGLMSLRANSSVEMLLGLCFDSRNVGRLRALDAELVAYFDP